MRITLVLTALLTIPTIGSAQDSKGVELRIPFEKIRALFLADGQVLELYRKKNVWPDESGEDKDEWIQIAFGKRLKARTKDRTPENETSLGTGVFAKDGYIYVQAGWRARRKEIETHFDGTLAARVAIIMSGGIWDTRVEDLDVTWNSAVPLVRDIVANEVMEPPVRDWLHNELPAKLNEVSRSLLDGKPNLKALVGQLSASLVGDEVVLHALTVEPLCDLGDIRDRRGNNKLTVALKNCDKLKVGIIDRSELDASSATVLSTIDIKDKIDGKSDVSFKTAPGATVVVRGKIDGRSTVHIEAPSGHVEFHEEINGQSHLYISARTVIFHKKIDGGWSNGRITEVHLALDNDGSVSAPELCAHLYWRRAVPSGRAPRISVSKVHWAGKIEEKK